jgi:acetyltransferase-like isoleucine patch superfamily enzyme
MRSPNRRGGSISDVLAMLERLCWLLLPSPRKNALLRRFGHQIADTARIGPTIVLGVKRFEIGDNVRIALLNVFKGLSLVRIDGYAMINSFNWISAAPEFQEIDPQAGTLHMGYGSGIRSRNYLDCSGTIILGPYCAVGGQRVFLQSHEPDFTQDRQVAGRVEMGHHSIAGTRAMLMMGAHLPDQSVLAANSVMLSSNGDQLRKGVYAGSPAAWKGDVTGAWYERTSHFMSNNIVVGTMGPED